MNNLIESKQFSRVTIVLRNPHEYEDYVIFDPSLPSAMAKAIKFGKQHYGDRFEKVWVFPRNYIKEARVLAEQGRIIP
jgi:hypothetical protein